MNLMDILFISSTRREMIKRGKNPKNLEFIYIAITLGD